MAAVGDRTADVIGAIADRHVRTRGLEWSLGQTAAHLVVGVRSHRVWARGEAKIDYLVPDLAAVNVRGMESVQERDPAALAAIVRREHATFVSQAPKQPAGACLTRGGTRPVSGGDDLRPPGEMPVRRWDIATTLGSP
ncbi:MAG: hypothetical protein ACLQCU_08315 [Acidimicrobiales bacterium]